MSFIKIFSFLRYLVYIIIPFFTFFALDYVVDYINEGKIKYQFIYSLENTVKPKTTYFDFITDSGEKIKIEMADISYDSEEVLQAVYDFKPEYEILYKQGKFADDEFNALNIQKVDIQKLGREKIVLDYYLEFEFKDTEIIYEKMILLNSLFEHELNQLLSPNISLATERLKQYIDFLRDKIILETKKTETRIEEINFELEAIKIRIDTLFGIMDMQKFKKDQTSQDDEIAYMIAQKNFFEDFSQITKKDLKQDIREIETLVKLGEYPTANKIFLKFAENLLFKVSNDMVGLKLIDHKVINIIDNRKISFFIRFLFTMLLSILVISLVELLIKRIKII